MESDAADFWKRKAREVATFVNGAWWLERLLGPFVILNIIFALLILVFRHGEVGLGPVWAAYGVCFFGIAVYAVVRIERLKFGVTDGLVRIEHYLGMNNRLTAANAGFTRWPEPRDIEGSTFAPEFRPLITPLCISAAFLLAGWLMPLFGSDSPTVLAGNPQEPTTWPEVESWMQDMRNTNLVDEDAIEQFEDKLAELRAQDAQQWYSQNSLEAGENLRDQAASSIQSLHQNLDSASEILGAMSQALEMRDAKALKELDSLMKQALENLEMGNLPLNQEMLDTMRSLDPANMPKLSQEQMKQLMQRMREGMKSAQESGALGELGEGMQGMSQEQLQQMFGQGNGMTLQELFGGGSGIDRGPGEAPLAYRDEAQLPGIADIEGVSNSNLDEAIVGDTLSVSQVEGEVDKAEFEGVRESRGADYTGKGGEAVWKNNLTPEEQKILRNYFK